MLIVNEIYTSIQGEGTQTGELCTFIRLSGCSFGCYYCDTQHACGEDGKKYGVTDIINLIGNLDTNLVLITGGEPLEQRETPRLASNLLDIGYEVLVETNGSKDISVLPKKAIKIVDVKLPWVGSKNYFFYDNLKHITADDELKFVIDGLEGYNWAKDFIEENRIPCKIIFSPCFGRLDGAVLAEWIIRDRIDVRFGLQLHKILWGNRRGV
jgi:7-carboxy-7-deazaguanine synthase